MIGDNVFQTTQNLQNQAANLYSGITGGGAQSAYQDVINRGLADIEEQRQMARNRLDASAPAGVFGGSRQAVAQRLTDRDYDKMAADFAAQQRLAEFNQRMTAAGRQTQLGQQMFGQGRIGLQEQQSAAQAQQAEQQQLLNAARAQVLQELGYPTQALATAAGLFGQMPSFNQTQQIAETPGLFDTLAGIGQAIPLFTGSGPLSFLNPFS